MMKAADRDRVLVADLAIERTRLSKANVVRFGGRAAADGARLRGDEFAVLLVAGEWFSAQCDGAERLSLGVGVSGPPRAIGIARK